MDVDAIYEWKIQWTRLRYCWLIVTVYDAPKQNVADS